MPRPFLTSEFSGTGTANGGRPKLWIGAGEAHGRVADDEEPERREILLQAGMGSGPGSFLLRVRLDEFSDSGLSAMLGPQIRNLSFGQEFIVFSETTYGGWLMSEQLYMVVVNQASFMKCELREASGGRIFLG